ncbi:lachesin [Trichonephila clavipes]|nr:lachesin [Trichonephila clavipes]
MLSGCVASDNKLSIVALIVLPSLTVTVINLTKIKTRFFIKDYQLSFHMSLCCFFMAPLQLSDDDFGAEDNLLHGFSVSNPERWAAFSIFVRGGKTTRAGPGAGIAIFPHGVIFRAIQCIRYATFFFKECIREEYGAYRTNEHINTVEDKRVNKAKETPQLKKEEIQEETNGQPENKITWILLFLSFALLLGQKCNSAVPT